MRRSQPPPPAAPVCPLRLPPSAADASFGPLGPAPPAASCSKIPHSAVESSAAAVVVVVVASVFTVLVASLPLPEQAASSSASGNTHAASRGLDLLRFTLSFVSMVPSCDRHSGGRYG